VVHVKPDEAPEPLMLDELPASDPSSPPPLEPVHPTPVPRHRPTDEGEKQRRDDHGRRPGREPAPLPPRRPEKAKPPVSKTEDDREQLIDDAAGWRKVRRGLGWVQFGMFLALLPAAAYFAIAAYTTQTYKVLPDEVKDPPKGLLGLAGKNLFDEVELLYSYALPILPLLVVLFGRVGCMRVPSSAKTRGLAGGTLFLTFVTFAAFATFAAAHLVPILAGKDLPREARSVAWTVFIYFGLLAEAWFLLFVGQAGIAVNNWRIMREIALSLLLLIIVIAGSVIADDYYSSILTSLKLDPDNPTNRALVVRGVCLLVSVIFVFRVISISGMVRRSIRQWLNDRKDVLETVAD
jgi:hypothetical protein